MKKMMLCAAALLTLLLLLPLHAGAEAFPPAACHRLDYKTSGLCLFAKNEKALSALRDARARIASFSREPHDRGQRIHLLLEATTAVSQPDFLLPLLSKVPGIRPETVE